MKLKAITTGWHRLKSLSPPIQSIPNRPVHSYIKIPTLGVEKAARAAVASILDHVQENAGAYTAIAIVAVIITGVLVAIKVGNYFHTAEPTKPSSSERWPNLPRNIQKAMQGIMNSKGGEAHMEGVFPASNDNVKKVRDFVNDLHAHVPAHHGGNPDLNVRREYAENVAERATQAKEVSDSLETLSENREKVLVEDAKLIARELQNIAERAERECQELLP